MLIHAKMPAVYTYNTGRQGQCEKYDKTCITLPKLSIYVVPNYCAYVQYIAALSYKVNLAKQAMAIQTKDTAVQ